MRNREEIEDSLNFCKDIKYYESSEKGFLFDDTNFPNLKEYIHWMNRTDDTIATDYTRFEETLHLTEAIKAPQVEEKEVSVPKSNPKTIFSFLLELVICLAISLGIVFLVSNFVVSHTKVVGHSMESTLHDGEYLLINRLTYYFKDPKQFDIIVFKHTDEEKYIKRVIACPKQTVQIIDGNIYVDNKVINENYGNATIVDPGLAAKPITLGEDEYFVLGDNRNGSSDSRFPEVGLIHRDSILGKVLLRFYPFDKFGTVE